MIRGGKLTHGQKLPTERELGDLFGVSRSTIRDAIQKLGIFGYVEVRQGDGTIIRAPDRDTFVQPFQNLLVSEPYLSDDLLMFRRLTEPEVARLAAENCTEKDAQVLDDCLTRQLFAIKSKVPLADEDYIFHQEIAKISKNFVVMHLLDTLHILLKELRQAVLAGNQAELTLRQHTKMARAIIEHEAEAARLATIEHLDWVIDTSKRSMQILKDVSEPVTGEPKVP